jgi:hypothetical protein
MFAAPILFKFKFKITSAVLPTTWGDVFYYQTMLYGQLAGVPA